MVKARNLACKLTQNVWLQDLTLSPQPEHQPENLREVSKAQRRSFALPLNEYQQHAPSRNEGMARAYLSGAYTMSEIGDHFGVYYMTVSRPVRGFERKVK